MSAHLTCPICAKEFKCDGPHEGPSEEIGVVKKCPLHKGAIYVFVKDDTGKGVHKVLTGCETRKSSNSDPEGYAFYEQLDVGAYTVNIDLEGSDDKTINENHYAFSRISLKPSVEAGKITTVEFQINRFGTLEVQVKRSDTKKLISAVKIRVDSKESSDNPLNPDEPSLESGPVVFKKLKPTSAYKAAVQLVEVHDKKFRISGAPVQDDLKITPDGPNKIEFLVDPLYWIKFKLLEGEAVVPGTIMLQQSGKEETQAQDIDGVKGLENLDAGAMKVNRVDISAASCEFVSIKPKG